MKNKLLKPVILSLLALSLVGCDGKQMGLTDKNAENQIAEADEDMNKENKPAKDNIDKSKLENTEDKKENSDKDKKESEDKNLHTKDGKYVTTLIAKLKGEADDYITSTAYAYKIEDDKLVISGSFDYHEDPDNYEKVEEIKNEEDHKFVINDKTEFQAVGGMAPAQKFTKEDFLKYLEECKDTGLALIIYVEDGIAKTVEISS